MFKILLVVYVVGGGANSEYDYSTNFSFQEFHSIEDCETVATKMEAMSTKWTYDGGKKVIPAHYSTECVTMTAKEASTYTPPVTTTVDTSKPATSQPPSFIDELPAKRWNDRD